VKVAIFAIDGWRRMEGYAVIDDETVVGWRHDDRENGPVVIKAESGDRVGEMLEQIRAAA
jgi:hypothetical protein